MRKAFALVFVLALLIVSVGGGVSAERLFGVTAQRTTGAEMAGNARTQAQQAIIVDHTSTDITAIPQEWIEAAKQSLHIGYGHTSHGSQLTTGMTDLVSFANNGGLGLALPQDIFRWNSGGTGGALDLRESSDGYLEGDCGYYPQWVNETREYLGNPDPATGRGTNNPEINVIIWSWCGQASGRTEGEMLATYLQPMSELEGDYPGVTFVYMTGHADGSGESGNLHLRNQQIREYCIQNNKVLYDFYDIECYDPGGAYYGDKLVNDNCDYDSDGNDSRDRNWAQDWQNSHNEGADWYGCGCAHSQGLNCNRKAYAAWWLWARLAGWDGASDGAAVDAQKMAWAVVPEQGDTITYTVVIQDLAAPLTSTIYMTDVVPVGLAYVNGSLTATAGNFDDGAAPTLLWAGSLSETPTVTITYAATVATSETQAISNSAVIAVDGYEDVISTATVIANGYPFYLPIVLG